MNAILPHLLRPYWLMLLPLMGWLLWRLWHRERRVGQWQQLLPARWHSVLLTRGRLHRSKLPWMLLGLAWLLAVLALLGPAWERQQQPSLKRIDPLVVLLEVTPAMLAADVGPDRLETAKRKLMDLLDTRRDAQTAVVVFAGSAHTLVPLSDDLHTTRNLLAAVTPAIMPVAGQRADLAVAQALELLAQSGLGRGRLLLMGTSLGADERAVIAEQLRQSGDTLSILGIGTSRGAPIVGPDGSFLRDAQGVILIPRLDRTALAEAAAAFGGRYQTARLDDADLDALGLLSGGLQGDESQLPLAAWRDQGHWLLLPLLLLAACAGRRGWLFCGALLILPAPPALALEWRDLWLRPDQQGQRLIAEERPDEAARRFTDTQWQGFSAYLAGDYATAAERFAQSDTPVAHYNRGNALAQAGQLQSALEAYDQALYLDRTLEPARHNRALVEELLRQQEESAATPDAEPAEDTPEPAPSSDPGAQGQTEAEPNGQPGDEQPTPTTAEPGGASEPLSPGALEARQEADQWLRRIPDDPGELLRQKFLFQQRMRQGG